MQLSRLGYALALALLAVRLASADPISNLVVFGDSLSDTGNVAAATNGAYPPSPPYSNGRFSNGPIWIEQLASQLHLPPPTPSLKGGLDYAYGFAQTGQGNGPTSVSGLTVPNMGTQVSSYLASHTPSSGDLFVLWGGANDFFHGQTDPSIPAANIASAVKTLALAGARQFLVPNLPRLGNTPYGATLSSADKTGLNNLSLAFDKDLHTDLLNLQNSMPGITIHRLNTAAILNNMQKNPSLYHLHNVSDSALQSGNSGATDYLFWDSVHPTTQADLFIARGAAHSLPEPGTLTLAALGMLGIAGWRGRRMVASC